MREISELIYETCKTYLSTQGKFILVLWLFIGVIVAIYFGKLAAAIDPATGAVTHGFPAIKVAVILLFSLIAVANAQQQRSGWVTDSRAGCKAWSNYMQDGETITARKPCFAE